MARKRKGRKKPAERTARVAKVSGRLLQTTTGLRRCRTRTPAVAASPNRPTTARPENDVLP